MLVDSLRGALLEHYVDSSLLWCDHTASIDSISVATAALRQRAPAPALLSRWYGPNRIKIPSLAPSRPLLSPPTLLPSLSLAFHTDCFAAVNGSRGERECERDRDTNTECMCVCGSHRRRERTSKREIGGKRVSRRSGRLYFCF